MQTKIVLRQEDALTGLKSNKAGRFRLIFADPPYNLSGKNHQTVHAGKLTTCNKGKWDEVDDIHAFNEEWISECVRLLADDGTIWISGTLHNHPSVGVILKKLGLWIVNDVVWYKRNAPPLRICTRFAPSTEIIWVASKSKKYYFNYALAKEINNGKQMKNLWDMPATRHVTSHPTEKPITLMERIINIATAPGDAILDPFMGSGTTGVVAKSMGRSFLGYEIDSDYFAIASERIVKTKKFNGKADIANKATTSTR